MVEHNGRSYHHHNGAEIASLSPEQGEYAGQGYQRQLDEEGPRLAWAEVGVKAADELALIRVVTGAEAHPTPGTLHSPGGFPSWTVPPLQSRWGRLEIKRRYHPPCIQRPRAPAGSFRSPGKLAVRTLHRADQTLTNPGAVDLLSSKNE